MTIITLLLCLHMGYAVAATFVIMLRYWPDPRWWHIFSVGASHLLLTFSTLYALISQPWNVGWRVVLLLAAYTLTDVGLYLFLVRKEPAKPLG